MFKDIRRKKVLITGASSGIGADIAKLFASYGAFVGIHYCNSEKEAAALKRHIILRHKVRAEVFKADLLNISACNRLISSYIKIFHGLDVLINNAGGIHGFKNFLSLDEKSWDDTFALNVKAAFFLAKGAFSYMKNNDGGRIINISSIAAKYGGSPDSLHYGAAKAALEAVTKGLARAGAKYNILVNSIRGGFIDTPFHKKIGRKDKDIKDRIGLIPLRRAGEAADISRMALFLASDGGDYITGEIFTVAGGD